MLKAVREFGTYITANRTFIPNYGDRYRHGETISTAFVESAINQVVSKRMVKKQQMRWTDRGAHLLLQVRIRVLNEEWRSTLSHWYPAMQETCDAKAAWPPVFPGLQFVQIANGVAVVVGIKKPPHGFSHDVKLIDG